VERAEEAENGKPTNGKKVDRRRKEVDSPSIPNCLVSALFGQTIVLCRFKLDFAFCKSASIDISRFRVPKGKMAGWEWSCAILFACCSLVPNSRIQRESQPRQTIRRTLSRRVSEHATAVQLAERACRAAPDRTGDGAQEAPASQAQEWLTDLVFLGAESLQIAPRYLVHGICREANPVSSETPQKRIKRSIDPASIRPTYRYRQDLPPFRSTAESGVSERARDGRTW